MKLLISNLTLYQTHVKEFHFSSHVHKFAFGISVGFITYTPITSLSHVAMRLLFLHSLDITELDLKRVLYQIIGRYVDQFNCSTKCFSKYLL